MHFTVQCQDFIIPDNCSNPVLEVSYSQLNGGSETQEVVSFAALDVKGNLFCSFSVAISPNNDMLV